MFSGPNWRSLPSGEWAYFVAITGFWVTASLLVMYILHSIERCQAIPWMTIEVIYCCLWAFFYGTASVAMVVAASKYSGGSAFIAGSAFGFIAMVVYGYDGFLKFRCWRAGQPAQGDGTPQDGPVFFCCV